MGSSVVLSDVGIKIPHEDMQFNRETVADLLGRSQLSFPGAQPVSFARSHFAELQRRDYYLCEKTDGMRCLLYLSAFPDTGEGPIEAQHLIDRKNDYYYIPRDALHLPHQNDMTGFHTGTILDGELVRQKHKDGREVLMFLIFDCLCLDGNNIMDRPLDIRLGKVSAFVYEPWKAFAKQYPEDVEAQPFQFQLKKMELPYGTEMMFKDILPKLPHGNDGLIFTCKSTPYVAGTDPHILKWKPPHENTIDFKLQIGAFPTETDDEGVYEDWDARPSIDLLINHGDRTGYQKYADLELTDEEWEAMKSMGQMFDGRIIECFRDPVSGGWRPKLEDHDGTPRFRDDKRDANHVSTVESVRESIEDAVTEEDLINQAGKIKEAWKRRDAEAKKKREEEKRRIAEAEAAKKRQMDAARARQQQQQRPAPPPAADEMDDGPSYD